MQQPPPMMPAMPSFPQASITTEQIQKYLDENKKLILAILDNQNLGKLAECAQESVCLVSNLVDSVRCIRGSSTSGLGYQAQLQKNLMYLAAIADAQPQMPAVPPQMAPHPAMQQGAYYMQHPQAAAMAQQAGAFSPKMSVQFATPQHLQEQQQLHQQAIQGHMSMRPGGPANGMRPMHMDPALGGGPPASAGANSKQDATVGPDAQGGNASGHSNAE